MKKVTGNNEKVTETSKEKKKRSDSKKFGGENFIFHLFSEAFVSFRLEFGFKPVGCVAAAR